MQLIGMLSSWEIIYRALSKEFCGRYGRDEGNSFRSRVVIRVVKKKERKVATE